MRLASLISSAAIFGLAACSSVTAGPASDYDGLDRAQLLDDLQILASDTMQGREAGTPGNALARGYIIERLEGIGVDPVGESFEHPFEYSFRRGPGERADRAARPPQRVRPAAVARQPRGPPAPQPADQRPGADALRPAAGATCGPPPGPLARGMALGS